MKITEESFGESMGDVYELFLKCKTPKNFREFYLEYYQIIRSGLIKEKGLDFPNTDIISILHSNIGMLFSYFDPPDYHTVKAHKVWWFL